MRIVKAVREKTHMKLALTGPSGSGKTWAAIGIAKGLSDDGRVVVIDSENNSSSFYSGTTDEPGQWDFDVIPLKAPFTPQSYMAAVEAAVDAGYSVVVIDSLTHEWAASGGILDEKAAKDMQGGNSYTNWNGIKQIHNAFVESLLQAPIHIIATLRSKTNYVLETTTNKYGKEVQAPRKVGMAPISSDGIDYEFSIVFDIDRATHMAVASKDRTAMFGNKAMFLTPQIGKQLKAWLEGGADGANSASEGKSESVEATSSQKRGAKKNEKSKNDASKVQEPKKPTQQDTETPVPSQEWTEAQVPSQKDDDVPCLSPDQQGKLRLYLNTYKVEFQAFLRWASSKGLIAPTADVADFGLDDIRADQFTYIESLFTHERSRNQFIHHLNNLKRTA